MQTQLASFNGRTLAVLAFNHFVTGYIKVSLGRSGWIRTTEARRQQIYSLPQLTTLAHSEFFRIYGSADSQLTTLRVICGGERSRTAVFQKSNMLSTCLVFFVIHHRLGENTPTNNISFWIRRTVTRMKVTICPLV